MIRRILVLLAALLLLAGCGGGSDPAVVADPTPSPTVSPVEESSSAVPAAETPEAFIRRWLQLSVDMQNSGDSSLYRAATPGCVPCVNLADRVDDYYASGGSITFKGQRAVSVNAVPSSPGTSVFRVRLKTSGTEYKVASDAPEQTIAAGTDLLEVTLKSLSGQSWTVSDFSRVAQ